MHVQSFTRTALVAMIGLSTGVAAQSQAPLGGEVAQESAAPTKNPNEGMMPVHGVLMDDCAPTVTACGKLDKIKIEYRAGSTHFIINNVTEEAVTTLEPETTTRTVWEVTTVTTENQGWCRNTTTFYDVNRVETVRLNATITTTREFVPVVTAQITSTSTIEAVAVDQCIIKNPAYWPAPGAPTPGPVPPVVEKPQQASPVKDVPNRESPGPESAKNNASTEKDVKKGDAKGAPAAAAVSQAKKN